MNGDLPESVDPQSRFADWLADILEESAQDGAVLAEVRFGAGTILEPDFMENFRQAERRMRERYPDFYAEAIISGLSPARTNSAETFEACLLAREQGLAGIDFSAKPYDSEADWTEAYRWAEQAAEAGLGVTAHAGEFHRANIVAALGLPGISRVGHAVHATEPDLLEPLVESSVTVECCLTSNVLLGAVTSLEALPIVAFAEAGVPVTLNSDDPMRLCTTMGNEYELEVRLGFDSDALLGFTRQGVEASFTTPERKAAILRSIGM